MAVTRCQYLGGGEGTPEGHVQQEGHNRRQLSSRRPVPGHFSKRSPHSPKGTWNQADWQKATSNPLPQLRLWAVIIRGKCCTQYHPIQVDVSGTASHPGGRQWNRWPMTCVHTASIQTWVFHPQMHSTQFENRPFFISRCLGPGLCQCKGTNRPRSHPSHEPIFPRFYGAFEYILAKIWSPPKCEILGRQLAWDLSLLG